jgi:hypothetical protein
MIYDIYDRIEEKRKEIEEYIEEKIPLKKYINKYKPVFILIFVFIIFYLYIWAFGGGYTGELMVGGTKVGVGFFNSGVLGETAEEELARRKAETELAKLNKEEANERNRKEQEIKEKKRLKDIERQKREGAKIRKERARNTTNDYGVVDVFSNNIETSLLKKDINNSDIKINKERAKQEREKQENERALKERQNQRLARETELQAEKDNKEKRGKLEGYKDSKKQTLAKLQSADQYKKKDGSYYTGQEMAEIRTKQTENAFGKYTDLKQAQEDANKAYKEAKKKYKTGEMSNNELAKLKATADEARARKKHAKADLSAYKDIASQAQQNAYMSADTIGKRERYRELESKEYNTKEEAKAARKDMITAKKVMRSAQIDNALSGKISAKEAALDSKAAAAKEQTEKATAIEKRLAKGLKLDDLSRDERKIVSAERNKIKKEEKVQKRLQKAQSKQASIKNNINRVKNRATEMIQYKIIDAMTRKLAPIVGQSAASIVATYLYTMIYTVYAKLSSIFTGDGTFGLLNVVSIGFKILVVVFLLVIIGIIAVYVPVLFYLSTFFLVIKKVINFLQSRT